MPASGWSWAQAGLGRSGGGNSTGSGGRGAGARSGGAANGRAWDVSADGASTSSRTLSADATHDEHSTDDSGRTGLTREEDAISPARNEAQQAWQSVQNEINLMIKAAKSQEGADVSVRERDDALRALRQSTQAFPRPQELPPNEMGNLAEGAVRDLEARLADMQASLDKMYFDAATATSEDLVRSSRRVLTEKNTNSEHAHIPLSKSSDDISTIHNQLQMQLVQRDDGQHGRWQHQQQPPSNKFASKPLPAGGVAANGMVLFNIEKLRMLFEKALEENVGTVKKYIVELRDEVSKLQYQKQLLVGEVLRLEERNLLLSKERDEAMTTSAASTPSSFGIKHFTDTVQMDGKEMMASVVQLWEELFIPLLHRSRFYIAFVVSNRQTPDAFYYEVEYRRLKWLQTRHRFGRGDVLGQVGDAKAIDRELGLLARLLKKIISPAAREELYKHWQIPLNSKDRKAQLVHKWWAPGCDERTMTEGSALVCQLYRAHLNSDMYDLVYVKSQTPRTPKLPKLPKHGLQHIAM